LIKTAHLFKFLGVGRKAGVQLLIASVNIGDHQHHELHRSGPLFVFLGGSRFGPTPVSRLEAPKFDAHPKNYFLSSCNKRRFSPPSSTNQPKPAFVTFQGFLSACRFETSDVDTLMS